MTNPTIPPLQLVWVQNLIGFVKGEFPADKRWKPIFLKQLAALTGTVQPVAVGVKPRSAEVQEILDNMANVDLEIVEGYIESLEQRLSAVPAPSMKIARTCPNCGVLEGMECKPACPRRIIAEMDARALTQPDAGKGDGW